MYFGLFLIFAGFVCQIAGMVKDENGLITDGFTLQALALLLAIPQVAH